jgi:hypothetical protein
LVLKEVFDGMVNEILREYEAANPDHQRASTKLNQLKLLFHQFEEKIEREYDALKATPPHKLSNHEWGLLERLEPWVLERRNRPVSEGEELLLRVEKRSGDS